MPGTLMSYCHLSSGASCGSTLLELHPTVGALMTAYRNAQVVGCIGLISDLVEIFSGGFETGGVRVRPFAVPMRLRPFALVATAGCRPSVRWACFADDFESGDTSLWAAP